MKQSRFLVFGLLLGLVGCNQCGGSKTATSANVDLSQAFNRDDVKKAVTDGKFTIINITEGSGPGIEAGKSAYVHYTGWLVDGKRFDTSRDRGEPLNFPLGAGRVIRGWDEGIKGMKVGERRILVIPPDMGYGAYGAGGVIPPQATLIFEVELADIKDVDQNADASK